MTSLWMNMSSKRGWRDGRLYGLPESTSSRSRTCPLNRRRIGARSRSKERHHQQTYKVCSDAMLAAGVDEATARRIASSHTSISHLLEPSNPMSDLEHIVMDLKNHLGNAPPEVYAEYLVWADEVLRKDGLLMYDRDSVIERNLALGIQQHTAEYLGVGDDNGGRSIVIRFNDIDATPFLIGTGAIVPNVPLVLRHPLAMSWKLWQASGFPLPAED